MIISSIISIFSPTHSNSYIGFSLLKKKNSHPVMPTAKKIVGYKTVGLARGAKKKVFLASPTFTQSFNSVQAKATCYQNSHGFKTNCTCGFYSFKKKERAFTYEGKTTGIVVETVLSGRYVEYSHGWRAENQRVTEIIVDLCQDCKANPAQAFALQWREDLVPVCLNDALDYAPSLTFTFKEIENRMDVPANYKFDRPAVISRYSTVPATREQLNANKFRRLMQRIKDNW